jgi:rubrerythrin
MQLGNTMSSQGSTTKDETTKLENSTYNILIALGKEARFLYSAIDTYIDDARKDNNSEVENMWKTIKQERERHLAMLRGALDKQAKEQKLH